MSKNLLQLEELEKFT